VGSETKQGREIKQFALDEASLHPVDLVARIAKKFAISRQAASSHVRRLVRLGLLNKVGRTRDALYFLTFLDEVDLSLPLPGSPDESTVYQAHIRPRLGLPPDVEQLLKYGFCEMYNNALDHSQGTKITVRYGRTAASTILCVSDDGVGIFNKIAAAFGLSDPRESILELSKGKLTTDQSRHSGEGIFFTSRMMDKYAIASGRLQFSHDSFCEDWLLEQGADVPGTTVRMEVLHDTTRTVQAVFNQYSIDSDECGFDRTHVPLSLAQYEHEHLVSRSQARRVLSRFERFKEVILDFKGVKTIGQAFADEIFRVYAGSAGAATIVCLHASSEVKKMIRRVQSPALLESEMWERIAAASTELEIVGAEGSAYVVTIASGEPAVLTWQSQEAVIFVKLGAVFCPLVEAPPDVRIAIAPHLTAFVQHVKTLHSLGITSSATGLPPPRK